MPAELQSIHEIGPAEWDRFVESHPLATVYHHSAWHRVIELSYGHKVRYCTIRSGDRLAAGLPFVLASDLFFGRRIIAFPYSDTCDPLVENEEQIEAIRECLLTLAIRRKCSSIEIRGFKTPAPLAFSPGNETRYVNFLLRLDHSDRALLQGFHESCIQRGIRKAERGHVDITEENTLNGVRAFYALHLKTRKKHGLPAQPFIFFKNLWSVLCPRDMMSILLASTNKMAVAAIVVLKFRDTLYYKFAASDAHFLGLRPNHLLMWHLMRSGAGEGYRYVDLGRTYTGDRGLMDWKRRWGAEPYRLRYSFMLSQGTGPVAQEGGRVHELLSRVFTRMPCFVIRMSGTLLYKYLA